MWPACCSPGAREGGVKSRIRSAIGAHAARLIRQFLTESLVLALTGAAMGLALAFGCVRLLKFYLDLYLPLSQPHPD